MNVLPVTPNLMADDVNSTMDFYTSLGFSTIMTVPESGTFDWALIARDDVQLMLQKETSIKEEYPQLKSYSAGGALTIYIRIANIADFYEQCKEQVKLIKPLNKTSYEAEEFAIQDPNGFILTFSEMKL